MIRCYLHYLVKELRNIIIKKTKRYEDMHNSDRKILFIFGLVTVLLIPSVITKSNFIKWGVMFACFIITFFKFFTFDFIEKDGDENNNTNKLLIILCILSLIVIIPFTLFKKDILFLIYDFYILFDTVYYLKG